MHERAGQFLNSQDTSPAAVESFLNDIGARALFLPYEQQRLYAPLNRTLRLALEHDELYMKYLGHQNADGSIPKISPREILLSTRYTMSNYWKNNVDPATMDFFMTTYAGWMKKIQAPTIIGVNRPAIRPGGDSVSQIIVDKNGILSGPFKDSVIPGTGFRSIVFDPGNKVVNARFSDDSKGAFEEQYHDVFITSMNEAYGRVAEEYANIKQLVATIR